MKKSIKASARDHKASCKEYYGKNRDKILFKKREFYRKNRELVLERNKKNHAKPETAERIRARRKQFYKENKARILDEKKAQYEAARSTDTEGQKIRKRESYRRSRNKQLARKRELSTGWNKEEFMSAWIIQEGRCMTCQKKMKMSGQGKNSVAADHCHRTGRQRALLCQPCNFAIGLMQDNPSTMVRAAAYVTLYVALHDDRKEEFPIVPKHTYNRNRWWKPDGRKTKKTRDKVDGYF